MPPTLSNLRLAPFDYSAERFSNLDSWDLDENVSSGGSYPMFVKLAIDYAGYDDDDDDDLEDLSDDAMWLLHDVASLLASESSTFVIYANGLLDSFARILGAVASKRSPYDLWIPETRARVTGLGTVEHPHIVPMPWFSAILDAELAQRLAKTRGATGPNIFYYVVPTPNGQIDEEMRKLPPDRSLDWFVERQRPLLWTGDEQMHINIMCGGDQAERIRTRIRAD